MAEQDGEDAGRGSQIEKFGDEKGRISPQRRIV